METVAGGGLFKQSAHFLFARLWFSQAAALVVAGAGRTAATSC